MIFEPGAAIVVRDMVFGRPFTAFPQTVAWDTGDELAVLLQPGTVGYAPALWIKSLRDNDPEARAGILPAYARRDWEIGEWTWERTIRLAILSDSKYFAIDPMWTQEGEFLCWYVNFQLPFVRTSIGVDTSDLHIDLIVRPDLTYYWKDEDEYEQAQQLGLVEPEWERGIERGRDEVLSMINQRVGPFGRDWPAPDLNPIPQLSAAWADPSPLAAPAD
jgi:protein associated with RNAse G/E